MEKSTEEMENGFLDPEAVGRKIAGSSHREVVGGAWEEIGKLQYAFLLERGLQPHHTLLDIGCGALRGGVWFVPYLSPGHYFGVDVNQELLDCGRAELARIDAHGRLPEQNLQCGGHFDFSPFARTFDFAVAQSLFAHLGLNTIRRCLEQLADVLAPDGVLYATFFERPDDAPARATREHRPGDIATSDVADPYHYSVEDFRHLCRGLPLDVEYIGEWAHPAGEKMLAFRARKERRRGGLSDPQNLVLADTLPPGGDHYRAYVGPPDRFDFMSASQFNLLTTLGLRDRHKVLDFGCGSLRLGRLLIPFLRRGLYFGIDPNRWLIEDALDCELGRDAARIKQPRFAHNGDFDCGVFGTKFDFVMAQSIVTHCGPDLFAAFVKTAGAALEPGGLIAFSYCRTDAPTPVNDGWHYPECVFYRQSDVEAFIAEAGLVGRAIPWFHPGATWFVAAHAAERLPSPDQLHYLRGAVLHDPQFASSRP